MSGGVEAVGAAEKEAVKGMCNKVKSRWKDVMKFSRDKPRAIQRAIAGQLTAYKKDLLTKEKVWLESEDAKVVEDPLESTLAQDGTNTTQPNEDKVGKKRLSNWLTV